MGTCPSRITIRTGNERACCPSTWACPVKNTSARPRNGAVDSDPLAARRGGKGGRHGGEDQVVAITQAGEDLALPEEVDLAYCRFVLLHVVDPVAVLRKMVAALRPGGYLLAQEPITSAGRIDGAAMSMPDGRHPDVGAQLPALVRRLGVELVDAWRRLRPGRDRGRLRTTSRASPASIPATTRSCSRL